MRRLIALAGACLATGAFAQGRSDVVVADFNGATYGDWKVTGTAFGAGPARGTLEGQMPVSGFRGAGLVNSYLGGDNSTGRLVSPPFALSRRYLNFLIGGGMKPGFACMNLVADDKIVRTATGPNDKPGGSEALAWQTWDLKDLEGKSARLEIVDEATGGWGHINVDEITMSDEKAQVPIESDVLYAETYRPQFHFSPAKGWTNDPNGLVYFWGEYHLFFQHNPFATEWGNMTWGHAVSKDLVHWTQLANAIEPDKLGTIFSGSAVMDTRNTTGFGTPGAPAMVAIYTAAGDTSPESKGVPFTQCIAFSTDRGRTFTKYTGNPVLPHIIGGNRDPKVTWFEPTRRWIMALYLDGSEYALFSSPDLKKWTKIQSVSIKDCGECPDFFEIPVRDEPGATRWVMTAANGFYLVGTFDGTQFKVESGPHQADYGGNYYAVQSYSNVPKTDGRRIQVAWMNGGAYPGMPFNQQMSFPCEMTLRRTPAGLQLYRWPVREITSLRTETQVVSARALEPSVNPLKGVKCECADIDLEISVGQARKIILKVSGETITWDSASSTVEALGKKGPLAAGNGRIKLRVLADRTSLELFGNGGALSMTSCCLPQPGAHELELTAEGAGARLLKATVHHLRSSWPQAPTK